MPYNRIQSFNYYSPPPPPPTPPSPPPPPPPPPPPSPPPPPPPPPPTPHHMIVIVCVSVGGLFFLAFLASAFFCFRKRLRKGAAEEAEAVAVVEHVRVHEEIVPGPCGEPEVVAVSVDEDIEVVEMVEKSDAVVEGQYSGLAFGRKPPETSSGSPNHKG